VARTIFFAEVEAGDSDSDGRDDGLDDFYGSADFDSAERSHDQAAVGSSGVVGEFDVSFGYDDLESSVVPSGTRRVLLLRCRLGDSS
jgi:hypothetical protein